MKRTGATLAALAALTAVALPAAAAVPPGNGGAAYSDQPAAEPGARAADYGPATATWYGPGFFGNRTACGKVLTHVMLGVAHRRLPCGTKVVLAYRNRTIVVPVIDRGPFARGIEYDLTQATARRLGMRQTSRLRVAALH
jgi:rare lipoprotein A (peptidoglycan hydrolase)